MAGQPAGPVVEDGAPSRSLRQSLPRRGEPVRHRDAAARVDSELPGQPAAQAEDLHPVPYAAARFASYRTSALETPSATLTPFRTPPETYECGDVHILLCAECYVHTQSPAGNSRYPGCSCSRWPSGRRPGASFRKRDSATPAPSASRSGCAGQLGRHEPPVPVRSGAVKARFHDVRQRSPSGRRVPRQARPRRADRFRINRPRPGRRASAGMSPRRHRALRAATR